jgi:predicted XRE-type DNA-binding protein
MAEKRTAEELAEWRRVNIFLQIGNSLSRAAALSRRAEMMNCILKDIRTNSLTPAKAAKKYGTTAETIRAVKTGSIDLLTFNILRAMFRHAGIPIPPPFV